MNPSPLTSQFESSELHRYSRQITLPEVGPEGQRQLKEASVLIVGAGGLGSPAALYLAAAGVGQITLVDADHVDVTNLHRQVLYTTADVGAPKLEVAQQRLRALNPHVNVTIHPTRLTAENALELIQGHRVVMDGTDAFEPRYVINDACVRAGVPNVSASIGQFEGQVSVYATAHGPCYRCIFPSPPPPGLVPSCAEGGVLGVLPGLLGTVQATEVLKLLLGIGEPLIGRLLVVDTLGMRFRTLRFERDTACPVCGQAATPGSPASDTITTPRIMPAIPEITVHEYHHMREQGSRPFLLDVRKKEEYDIANLGGALIPLDELPERMGELEEHKDDDLLVVHCRSGARSAQAVALLRERGFTNAVNLRGGILAWSDEIDPSTPKY